MHGAGRVNTGSNKGNKLEVFTYLILVSLPFIFDPHHFYNALTCLPCTALHMYFYHEHFVKLKIFGNIFPTKA